MKAISLLIMFFTTIACFAQEPVAAIEQRDFNILYRGYDNKIKVAVSNNDGCEIIITGQNCTIKDQDDFGYYAVNPGNGRIAYLNVSLVDGNDTTLIARNEYRISRMPYPTLYWGAAKSGSKAARSSRLVQAKYPPEVPLNAYFKVTHWKMYVADSLVAEGDGGNMKNANEFLSTPNENAIGVVIVVTCTGPDGEPVQVSGSWTLGAFDGREIQPIKVSGCG